LIFAFAITSISASERAALHRKGYFSAPFMNHPGAYPMAALILEKGLLENRCWAGF
jgi:hypothetical protein